MSKKFLAAAILATLSIGAFAQGATPPAADASTAQLKKDHPRRHEVNARLKNQDRRINKEVKEGQISKQQAASMHKQDRQTRQEERDMAAQDKGHITKTDQKALNQQENKTSKEIGK